MTVHILSHGKSLCMMRGTPAEWPTGHRWVSEDHALDADCPACVGASRSASASERDVPLWALNEIRSQIRDLFAKLRTEYPAHEFHLNDLPKDIVDWQKWQAKVTGQLQARADRAEARADRMNARTMALLDAVPQAAKWWAENPEGNR